MVKYVKICPRCGRPNDELSEACESDGEFLGMVPATPAEGTSAGEFGESSAPSGPDESMPEAAELAQAPATDWFGQPRQLLYLDVAANGQCHEIQDGWVIGQAHPTSQAQVQLEDVPGLSYVHRSHCRFDLHDGRWHVTAVAQPSYTNPTFLNRQRLAPGQSMPLRNGDRLVLSNVALNVRIIEL